MSLLRIFLFCFAVLWLVFDLRMGLEILSYVRADYATYVSQRPGERSLRNFENFHQVLDRSRPFLAGQSSYMFLSEEGTPYLSHMRYFTYPSVPLPLGEPAEHANIWIVYKRPDISVNDQGELVAKQQVISAPGDVLERFDDSSFLFRTR